MEKKIAVFTGTRADYGLLRPVIIKMLRSAVLQPLVCVTGAHLSASLGGTVAEILADNIPIAAQIDILKYSQGKLETAKTVAFAINAFSEWLNDVKPNAVMLLGDRYEAFAAASAAAMLEIPIIHISGGDVTLGAADEFFRHCITKMSALHFPSCANSAWRIMQLGEQPSTIHCVGGLGDENLRKLKHLSLNKLSASLNVALENKNFLIITYHPETAGGADIRYQMEQLLAALSCFEIVKIFTKANADNGGATINDMLDDYCAKTQNAYAFTSLGVQRYLSCMKYAAAVVGNSSSGVVEAPSLGVPCVNIGTRQQGRIISDNIICCTASAASIVRAIKRSLSPAFIKRAALVKSPYNGGNTSAKIVRICEKFILANNSSAKVFYNLTQKDVQNNDRY